MAKKNVDATTGIESTEAPEAKNEIAEMVVKNKGKVKTAEDFLDEVKRQDEVLKARPTYDDYEKIVKPDSATLALLQKEGRLVSWYADTQVGVILKKK